MVYDIKNCFYECVRTVLNKVASKCLIRCSFSMINGLFK